MSAHLSNEIVERFHAQSLTSGDRGVIYNHVLGCDACRRRVVTAQTEAVALQTLTAHLLPGDDDEPFHLTPETIEAFVDDRLDALDRSTAKLHLEDCEECSNEVTDLRESLATMKAVSRQREERQPASMAATTSRIAFSTPLRIAAAVGLIAVATVALIVLFKWKSTPVQVTTLGREPTPFASPQMPGITASPAPESSPKVAENPPVNAPTERQQTAAALKDGSNEITLDHDGTVVGLPSLPTESRKAVREALSGQPLARPDVLDEVASAQVSERGTTGNDEKIRIVIPANSVILANQPTLRWNPLKTAESYRVEIADETFHQIAKSEDLPATSRSWTPPTRLSRGSIYTWTIRAVNKAGEPSPVTSQAKFKVLGEDKVRQLNRLKIGSQSHLALGLFYAREGMITEAQREFGILARQNPDSAIAKRLLKEVSSWRRR